MDTTAVPTGREPIRCLCGKKLSVDKIGPGKRARCPACGRSNAVAQDGDGHETHPPPSRWRCDFRLFVGSAALAVFIALGAYAVFRSAPSEIPLPSGPDTATDWIRVLQAAKSNEESIEALGKIAEYGPQAGGAVAVLVEHLKPNGHDLQVGLAASRALAKIGPEAVPALVAYLDQEKHLFARMRAIEALGAIGPPAEPALPKLLASFEVPSLRIPAAAAIQRIDRAVFLQEAVPLVVEQLRKNSIPLHRRLAAEILGKAGPDAAGAATALRDALRDHDESVRDAAALALKSFPAEQVPSN